jgi:hypothetical protein
MSRFKKMTIVVISGLPVAEINAHGGLPEGVEIFAKPVDFARLQSIAQQVWLAQSAAVAE